MAEVILMDFQAAGRASLTIIFVYYRKALSRRPRGSFFVVWRDKVYQRDPLFTRKLFRARGQRSFNIFRDAFPIINLVDEQFSQLLSPLGKSALHDLAKNFVIENSNSFFVAWSEANNGRSNVRP